MAEADFFGNATGFLWKVRKGRGSWKLSQSLRKVLLMTDTEDVWLFRVAAKSAWIGIMARIGSLCCSVVPAMWPSRRSRETSHVQWGVGEQESYWGSRKMTTEFWWCWGWESNRSQGLTRLGNLVQGRMLRIKGHLTTMHGSRVTY